MPRLSFGEIIRLNVEKKKIKDDIHQKELRIFELKEIVADAEALILKEQKKIDELHLSLCGTDFFSSVNSKAINTINFDKYDTLDLKKMALSEDNTVPSPNKTFISEEKLS